MALTRLQSRIVGAVILLGFVAFLFWWVQRRTGKEIDLVYDLSRLGRTDLVELKVELTQGGTLFRRAEYFYPKGEGRAPSQQRHRLKLPEGSYVARFLLSFSKGATIDRQTTFVVPGADPLHIAVPPAE